MKKHIFLQILIMACMTFNITIYAATIVTDGLVSYWTFDRASIDNNIVSDVWGENDAEIVGNPTIGDGHVRQGLKFDGSGDYVILDNIGNTQDRVPPFSFEFMIKSTDNSRPSTIFRVFETPCADRSRGWGIDINASRRPPNIRFGDPNPAAFDEGDDNVVYSKDSILVQHANLTRNGCHSRSVSFHHPISDGKWHHFVLVSGARFIDPEGKTYRDIYLYIDNVRMPISRVHGTSPDDFVAYTQPIFLGATNNDGKAKRYYLRGTIDEVRVYDRALTHNEISKNYANTVGLAVEPVQKLPVLWGDLKSKR